jgi:hypothetical protein
MRRPGMLMLEHVKVVFSIIIPEEFYLNFIITCFTLVSNTANYIIVILDNSLVFRVTIPDAVLIQFDLLRMSKIFLETCTCRGS